MTALLQPDIQHLKALSDGTGIMQHACYTFPNLAEGYTTDDNARALIAGVLLEDRPELATEARRLAARYLSFLTYAFNDQTGRFRNFLSYDRVWQEDIGSEDAHGRAIWALGTILGRSKDANFLGAAGELFARALVMVETLQSPRAWAFTILGAVEYLDLYRERREVETLMCSLCTKLYALYSVQSTEDWPWFEPVLSYCNAKLPHALIAAGALTGQNEWTQLGLQTLEWLVEEQTDNQHMSFVGSNGFYRLGQSRAMFDQQPVEAHAQLSACLAAYRTTGEEFWLDRARLTFDWFLGKNDLGASLYDPSSGGCRDGLHPDRVNQNQGAESTLAFLLSLLELRDVAHKLPVSSTDCFQEAPRKEAVV